MLISVNPSRVNVVYTYNMQRIELKTIKLLTPNTKGKDYVIGDLHGNIDCLKTVMKNLKPEDRLFITGDLVDRKKESEDLIDFIISHHHTGGLPEIVVVRGNHEDLCLKTIKEMESIFKSIPPSLELAEFEKIFEEKLNESSNINLHAQENGGLWLLKLYYREICDKDITVENGKVIYKTMSQIKEIKEYFESLPYIVHVGGDDPLNLVHANMPINDDQLQKKLYFLRELNEDEIEQAIWARNKPPVIFVNAGRDAKSIVTYCGHEIIFKAGIPCVRKETNTIDIDTGCYLTDCTIVVNHTDKKAELVGNLESNSPDIKEKLTLALKVINEHLAGLKENKFKPTDFQTSLFQKRKPSATLNEKPKLTSELKPPKRSKGE